MSFKLLNVKLSFYYSITSLIFNRYKIKIDKELNQEGKLIVSLTTMPGRIQKVWLVVESILRQTDKPDALILYLAKDEFKDEKVVPKRLLSLRKRGLQIIFVDENLKPHNKYFYAMSSFPKADIVTVDDDKIYPSDMVKVLKDGQKRHPEEICSVLARNITLKGDNLDLYHTWKVIREAAPPSHSLLGLGVGGVLYPSGSLHPEVFNKELLKQKSLLTDDLWIKIMALKNNTRIVSLGHMVREPLIAITGLASGNLMSQNVEGGQNDRVFESLIKYYQVDVSAFHA